MKYQSVLPACLLLLWTLTAFVSTKDELKIEVKKLGSDKFELSCTYGGKKPTKWTKDDMDLIAMENGQIDLEYKDEDSGTYKCKFDEENKASIFVKFRSCDNCIELDTPSILGMAIGDLVATAVIGVAVYLIASQARGSPMTSPQKKSSDRQHLVPNEVTGRSSHEHYERLRHKGGQKDTYDVINKK